MIKFGILSGVSALALLVAVTGCQPDRLAWDKDVDLIDAAAEDPGVNAGIDNNVADLPANNGSSWQPGTSQIGNADADGWTLADPSGNRLGMPIIYFAFDSDYLIPSEAKKVQEIAQYMGRYPTLALVIEGHCDQRGTEEYNRALGERRANAIRAALQASGVESNRLKTISYGEDKPVVQGDSEALRKQNRRGVPVPMRMPR